MYTIRVLFEAEYLTKALYDSIAKYSVVQNEQIAQDGLGQKSMGQDREAWDRIERLGIGQLRTYAHTNLMKAFSGQNVVNCVRYSTVFDLNWK